MVQWTTPFTIGITKMIPNSYIPPPSSGYSISFPNQPKKFRKVEDGCVDIYFYDWLYFGFRPLNHISALSTVKRYKFSQSTLILKQTTHNFSKSPSKSLLWLNQRQVVVFVLLRDSNPYYARERGVN